MAQVSQAYANRFPHKCKIYRLTDEDEFTDGTKEVIYEGKCAVYSSSTLRDFKSKNVEKNDDAIDIPELVEGISGACYVDYQDFNGTSNGKLIYKCLPVIYGKFKGTTIYFSEVQN